MSEAMSSPEDIARARHVKGLELPHDAWTSWLNTKQSLLDTLPLFKDPDPTMRSLPEDEFTTLKAYLSTTFPGPALLTLFVALQYQ
ncbi:hypothetical protein V8E55_001663 [Tylopilus felleus]